MTLKTLILSSAAALALTVAAHAQELRYANWAAPMHPINASQIEPLAEALNEATGGAVTLRAFHGGELGAGPADQYVRVVQGTAEMGWGLPGYTSSQFPKTMIAELPGALELDAPAHEAMWRAFDAKLAAEFPMTEVIALWGSEPNILMMRDREIRTPEDLRGLKIRVSGAAAADAIKALGATPVQLPVTQVYNGLQTVLIDGLVSGASVMSDFKLDEVVGTMSLGANLGRLSFFTVMNKSAYDALPDEAKAALDTDMRAELSARAEEAWKATADAGIEAARASDSTTVIDLTEDEIAAFDAALSPVTDAYIADVGGEAALAAMRGQ